MCIVQESNAYQAEAEIGEDEDTTNRFVQYGLVVMVMDMVELAHFWSGCTLRAEEMRTSKVQHWGC